MTSLINSELNNKNVFSQFTTSKNSPVNARNYYVPSTQNLYNTDNITQEKKSHALGYSIALTTLVVGFGLLALMKGLPKSFYQKTDKLYKYFDEKTTTLAARMKMLKSKNQKLPKLGNLYLDALKGARYMVEFAKGGFTFASLKDVIVGRAFIKMKKNKTLNKVPLLNKFHPWITNLFEKISTKTVKNAYTKTSGIFGEMRWKFKKTNEIIEKSPLKQGMSFERKNELIKILDEKIQKVKTLYDEGFDRKTVNERLELMGKNLGNMNEKVWEKTFGNLKEFLKDRKSYTTFIQEELAAPIKISHSQQVNHLKDSLVGEKGEIQEILDIYKELLPEKDFLKLKKIAHKSIKNLNKSTNLETDKLFDKIRDLKIGSAPNDSLSILASLGLIGWGLGKADNNDQRLSVALKYGIPALGAIATALYCTVSLVAGGPAIVFGLVSGLVINKIGTIADNARKRYEDKTLTIKNIAQDNLPKIDLNQNLFNYSKQ
ncbi:MAG TPA: hypothetical protein PLG15_01835 [Candidatus Gastranaerophilaceae bacterium]|nr:hypothetical protein [Candidatus Gastranaerophilaceae bacterium]HPT41104.1 hypothetical protein [Candidatus Gastranaerophilaceae bacterium]